MDRRMPRTLTPLLLAWIMMATVVSAETTLQVSKDGPLRTLAEARDEIRKRRMETPKEAFRVLVGDGRYEITEPLAFELGDGNVVYEAVAGTTPVISGGRRITSHWTEGEGGIWTTQLPPDWLFEQLWVNGQRAVRAREPDHFFHYLVACREQPIDGGKRAQQTLSVRPEDIVGLEGLTPEEIRQVQILAFHKWDTTRRFLDSANVENGQLVTSGRKMKSWNPLTRNTGYILENYLKALDEPGEFFLASGGQLSYRPRSGESMDDAEFIVPVCEKLVVIRGDSSHDKFVEDLEFRGIAFRHCGMLTPRSGFEPSQAASPIEAAMQIDGTKGVVLDHCEIGHTGGYGIWFRKGCTEGVLKHSFVHDLGAGGVRVGETRIATNESERTHDIVVDNNIVYDAGHLFPCAVGVWIGNSADNHVTHNEIANMYYTGISVGWRWGYDQSLAKGNRIEHNHIHHLGKGWLSDMGGIYTLGPSEGTVLRGNRIHDIESWGYGGWGLYNDEGSTGILLENNLVYRTKSGGYHQHYGRENVIRNNIFAFGREYQVRRSRVEKHLSFTYQQNIILWDSEKLFHGNWGDDGVEIGGNLYWRMGKPVDLSEADTSENSLIADPLFVDPAKDDFRFADTSIAKKIGFQPFDASQAGVDGDEAWKERARSLSMPTMQQAPAPPPLTFREDFEFGDLPVGSSVSATPDLGGIQVIDSPLANSGNKVLQFTDTPGQKHRYYPMLSIQPKHSDGTTSCKFAIRLGNNAVFQHEWRDSSHPYQSGPSLWFENGQLRSPNRVLTTLPVDEWILVEVTAKLGTDAGEWSVSVSIPHQQTQTFDGLPLVSDKWNRLDWLGFVSQADGDAVVLLDDLQLTRTE
ncbi:hypothetical protein RISK_001855 [Rhodopirellula islandica]|uniref:Right handed beta helix domain-containing protein n=2 Tax=Rhodopirellula islandica TaxID=595434 RepID=A0A0J1EKE5_RHOIS|nr:hypothetical protein RISK_001855 [Rhodopirellula islandica]